MLKKGYFLLVLHSHLPYVIGQREWPHGAGWLYEAAVESYIPLLDSLHDLKNEEISKENLNFLQDLEKTDGIFQDIDFSLWLKP